MHTCVAHCCISRTWHCCFHLLLSLSLNKAVAMCKMLLLKSPCCNYILFYSCWGFLYSHGDLFIPPLSLSLSFSFGLSPLSLFLLVVYASDTWRGKERKGAEAAASLGIHEIHAWFLLSCCVHIKSCLCMSHSCSVSLWLGIATSYSYKLYATCYMLQSSDAMSMPRPECVASCKIVNFIEFLAFYCV